MYDISNYETALVEKVNSIEFIKSVFRFYEGGKIVVLTDDVENVENLAGFRITAKEKPSIGGGWFEEKHSPIHSPDPAQISFTSGTEGKPKSMVISHNALADVVERLNTVMSVDETIAEYIGVPVTYSFGLGRCRAVSAAGGRFFVPEHGFNPREIAELLANDEINAISAVPSLWKMLLASPEVIGKLGRKVKWIEIGSQYMGAPEKRQMKALFPDAVIVQHYGLTEASRTTFLDVGNADSRQLESVGRPVGNVEVKISADNRIMIRGPHVASGRLDDTGRLLKIVDDEGWLLTNDFGHLENGALFYDGRADDIINFAGIKVNPEYLERKINESLKVDSNLTVCRVPDKIRGDGILIAVDGKKSHIEQSAIEQAVSAQLHLLGITSSAGIHIKTIDDIPRTPTGKVQRKLLAEEYCSNLDRPVTDGDDSLLDIFSKMFSGVRIDTGKSFRDLGGDSLNYVEMAISLERYLGHLPHHWDAMPISKLEKKKLTSTPPTSKYGWLSSMLSFSNMEMSTFLRAVAISFVVASHAGYYVISSGTSLLFILIGYNMARFKTDELLSPRRWVGLWKYASKILVPYYILAVAHVLWRKQLIPEIFFLYDNIVNRIITVAFPFWFVQVLMQCLVIMGVLFSIPAIRTYVKKDLWKHSFHLLLFFIAVRMLYPYVWITDYRNDLVPTRYMAFFLLGWCLYYSKHNYQKGLLAACAFIIAYLDDNTTRLAWAGNININSMVWLGVGSLLILYIPHVRIPRLFKDIGHIIANSTFYIFIFNGVFIFVSREILHIGHWSMLFIIGMTGGLLTWYASTCLGNLYSSRINHSG